MIVLYIHQRMQMEFIFSRNGQESYVSDERPYSSETLIINPQTLKVIMLVNKYSNMVYHSHTTDQSTDGRKHLLHNVIQQLSQYEPPDISS
jgi:hypothetical protein